MTVRAHPLGRLLARLGTAERHGSDWLASCPARPHRDASTRLRVTLGRNGRILLFCPSGYQAADVVGALAMRLSDLFAEARR